MRTSSVPAGVRFASALLVLTLLALSLVPAGCTGIGGGGSSSREIVPDINEGPAVAAARLAKELKGAKTLDAARPAVRETLARLGILVRSRDGAVMAHPTSPTVDVRYFEFQADNLALDHIERQGFTMAQLAQCMAETPTDGAAFWQDPVVLKRFIAGMVQAAKEKPNDPRSFGPLVLEELVRSRETSASLLDETLDPAAFPMTYLEMLAFSTSMMRGLAARTTQLDDTDGYGMLAQLDPVPYRVDPLASALLLAPTPAYALSSNPCTWLGDMLGEKGEDGKDIAQGYAGMGLDMTLGDIAETAAEGMSAAAGTTTKVAAGAAGYVTALISLVLTQGGFSIVVTPEPAVGHYYWGDPEHGDFKTKFVAHVSSRPVTDKDLQACLDWMGVELPDEKSADKATVHWVALYGVRDNRDPRKEPQHGEWSIEELDLTTGAGGGRFEQRVKDGKATLPVVMKGEKNAKDQKVGKVKKDRMVVQAELYAENPSGGKLLGMLFGGAPDAAKAWADRWFPKRAVGTMPVEWHEQTRWRGVLDNLNGTKLVFTSQRGLESIWDVKFEGSLSGEMPITGASKVDLGRDDAQFTIVGTGTKVDDGSTIKMNASYTFQHVAIGGTSDAPTLDFSGVKATVTVASDDGGGNASGGGEGRTVSIPLVPYSE